MATIVEYVLIGLSLLLLVFPSHLVPVIGMGLLLAAGLMFIARPASVFITLLPTAALSVREKTLVSWVGLRGAVPIMLATYPLEYTPVSGLKSELQELPIPAGSNVIGKAIVELGLPAEVLIVLIARGNEFLVPGGGTTLQAGDTLLILADKENFARVQSQIGGSQPISEWSQPATNDGAVIRAS